MALDHNNYLNTVELNRESELYLVFEAEFVPDQLEFFPAIVLAFEWSLSVNQRFHLTC